MQKEAAKGHVINVPKPVINEKQLQKESPLEWFGKKWIAFLHKYLQNCFLLLPLVKACRKFDFFYMHEKEWRSQADRGKYLRKFSLSLEDICELSLLLVTR